MRLAGIVDHRGRSAAAIETSVFFVDSEIPGLRPGNETAGFHGQLVPLGFSFARPVVSDPRSANDYRRGSVGSDVKDTSPRCQVREPRETRQRRVASRFPLSLPHL